MDKMELVFILDKSGSMANMVKDVVGGFNAMIEKQKRIEGEMLVSVVLFANDQTVLYDRVPISEIKPLTENNYPVGGCTALLDAIGGAIHHIGNVHKYARKEDVPTKTLFIITTDGMENASHRYSSERVKAMIRHEEEIYGWEFMYMAADISSIESAVNFGIRRDRTARYTSYSAMFVNIDDAVTHWRRDTDIGNSRHNGKKDGE